MESDLFPGSHVTWQNCVAGKTGVSVFCREHGSTLVQAIQRQSTPFTAVKRALPMTAPVHVSELCRNLQAVCFMFMSETQKLSIVPVVRSQKEAEKADLISMACFTWHRFTQTQRLA